MEEIKQEVVVETPEIVSNDPAPEVGPVTQDQVVEVVETVEVVEEVPAQ